MELVIKKLTDIEVAAKQIMENAHAELKVRDADMQNQTETFDAQLEALTQKRLKNLREKLRDENSEALQKLQTDTEQSLNALRLSFDKEHSALADAVVQRIIEV